MEIKFYTTSNPNESISFEIPYTVISDSFLDEELDVSPIEIKHTNVRAPFPRFCIVSLHVTESAKPQYWMVASDDVRTNVATGLSDHTVQLVEPTKWLERFMVGNKTVTQPKSFNFFENPVIAQAETIEGEGAVYLMKPHSDAHVVYPSPIDVDETDKQITFYNVGCFQFNNQFIESCDYSFSFKKDGKIIHEGSKSYDIEEYLGLTAGAFETKKLSELASTTGLVTITYNVTVRYSNKGKWSRRYGCAFHTKILSKTEYLTTGNTLKDAAMSMIKAAEILKDNNGSPAPRFRLNGDTANELAAIVSPEITVTNATLRESLDEVGKYVGAITRLDVEPNGDVFDFEVNFEKYCKDTTADVTELGDACEIFTSAGCEDYCTALDATVDNLVQYSDGGSIYDPAAQLFRTLRSEDSSYRVTEGSAKIFTAFPIERLDDVILRMYGDDGTPKENSILKYVFEEHEYSALSSYTTAFPESKAYALCYTIGQKNITGLDFTCPSAVSSIFETPALVNIVNKVFDTNYGNLNELNFTKLLFKVKYVPTGSARVRMHKPSSFGMIPSTLAYNQGASKLDSKAFGRAMFGAALRMGNVQTTYKYVAPVEAKVPSKGERFGEDGFLSEIREEFAPNQKTVTLTVSDGFNRLSQFVGVNKEHRIFEISERSTVDRHIVYEDFCLIGMTYHNENLSGSLVGARFATYLKDCFSQDDGRTPFTPFAIAQGYESKDIPLRTCFLPCVTYAMGNAVAFTVSFADNYGAGRSVENSGTRNEDEKEELYAIESDVRYTDLFGRVESIDLKIYDEVSEYALSKMTKEDFIESANSIPGMPSAFRPNDYPWVIATEGNRIHVDKDSRETIKTLTYQVSFLEGDGIKIAPGFAERVFSFATLPELVLVPLYKNIDNLTEWSKATKICKASKIESHSPKIISVTFEIDSDLSGVYNEWAIVDLTEQNPQNASEYRFLFGKNEPVKAGETKTIYFTFYH